MHKDKFINNSIKDESVIDLIVKAKNGDNTAFTELYRHYLLPIYRYIYLRVSNREDAEDLTQIVFLKAWNAIARFETRKNPFSSWLYKIAKNSIIDYYKKKKEIISDQPVESFSELMDRESEQAKIFDKNKKINIVCQAIHYLSEQQQEVLILKFINDLSNKEIASLLNKKEDAVRAIQSRGIRELRKRFNG